MWFFKTTMSQINYEANPTPPIINVVGKYPRQILGVSFGVATFPVGCNTE